MATNWNKIRNEYINGNISYRKLAEKHGISFNTLKEVAVKEKWFEKKKEQHNKIAIKTQQKTAEKLAEAEANRLIRISNAADKLLEKIELATEQLDIFLAKDKFKYTKQTKDKVTGKPIYVDVEEEKLKSVKTETIDRGEIKKLTSALKDLKDIQFTADEDKSQESPNININIVSATPEDMDGDE